MLKKLDLNTLPSYLFEGNSALEKFIHTIKDNTLINTKVSHQPQFESFVYSLREQEPLTAEKLKALLVNQPVEVNFLFAHAYSQFLMRVQELSEFTTLSHFLIKELIEDNPEHLHYFKHL